MSMSEYGRLFITIQIKITPVYSNKKYLSRDLGGQLVLTEMLIVRVWSRFLIYFKLSREYLRPLNRTITDKFV